MHPHSARFTIRNGSHWIFPSYFINNRCKRFPVSRACAKWPLIESTPPPPAASMRPRHPSQSMAHHRKMLLTNTQAKRLLLPFRQPGRSVRTSRKFSLIRSEWQSEKEGASAPFASPSILHYCSCIHFSHNGKRANFCFNWEPLAHAEK